MDVYSILKMVCKSGYRLKDLNKFKDCTCLISRGVSGSSSDIYRSILTPYKLVNKTIYSSDDIVGISVNGNRHDRVSFDKELVDIVISIGCTIITDKKYDRYRYYNVGEKELAQYLSKMNYVEVQDGVWKPSK